MYASFEDHRGDEEMFFSMMKVLRESSILEASYWSGLHGGNNGGIVVTKNKAIYIYERYGLFPNGADSSDYTFIKRKKGLTEEEFNKITDFIKTNLIDKEYADAMTRDAGHVLIVDYDGIHKKINCDFSEGNIFDVTRELVRKLAEPTVRDDKK
ncbi:hypothetical protein IJ101_02275 [Candidatus Saccharibacteria bacterium]|nr:hypothetical protein [Candidatus Saccharibacteria bacterium]